MSDRKTAIDFITHYGHQPKKLKDIVTLDIESEGLNLDYSHIEERWMALAGVGTGDATAAITSFADVRPQGVSMATIHEMIDKVPQPPRLDSLHLSDRYLDALLPVIGPTPRPFGNAFGMPVHTNPMFPFEIGCSTCEGTGEGTDSTYCRKCRGQGATLVEGMMTSGAWGEEKVILTGTLPKKFQPSFPTGLVPPPPTSRGLA